MEDTWQDLGLEKFTSEPLVSLSGLHILSSRTDMDDIDEAGTAGASPAAAMASPANITSS